MLYPGVVAAKPGTLGDNISQMHLIELVAGGLGMTEETELVNLSCCSVIPPLVHWPSFAFQLFVLQPLGRLLESQPAMV